MVSPARFLPSLRTRLARVRWIPLLEATPSSAEGGDQETHARLGYKPSTSCGVDLAIRIERAPTLTAERGEHFHTTLAVADPRDPHDPISDLFRKVLSLFSRRVLSLLQPFTDVVDSL